MREKSHLDAEMNAERAIARLMPAVRMIDNSLADKSL
jgi:hypothetical protein